MQLAVAVERIARDGVDPLLADAQESPQAGLIDERARDGAVDVVARHLRLAARAGEDGVVRAVRAVRVARADVLRHRVVGDGRRILRIRLFLQHVAVQRQDLLVAGAARVREAQAYRRAGRGEEDRRLRILADLRVRERRLVVVAHRADDVVEAIGHRLGFVIDRHLRLPVVRSAGRRRLAGLA